MVLETAKTEAILFSRRRKHRRCQTPIRVGDQTVIFAPEARIRRIVNQYGVPPAAARNLQLALVQGTILYASELTWAGQKGVEGEYQRAINRMARSTLGAFRSTPQGILAEESGLTPARPLLDHRQARFAHRLLARPQKGGGPEILERDSGGIVSRLRAASGVKPWETVEPQVWDKGRTFPGQCVILKEGPALDNAKSWYVNAWETIWTDGSRIEGGRVGVACAWRTREGVKEALD